MTKFNRDDNLHQGSLDEKEIEKIFNQATDETGAIDFEQVKDAIIQLKDKKIEQLKGIIKLMQDEVYTANIKFIKYEDENIRLKADIKKLKKEIQGLIDFDHEEAYELRQDLRALLKEFKE